MTVHGPLDRYPYALCNPPLPVRVHTRAGVEHGLLLGRWEQRALVLHGQDDQQHFSWLPIEDIRQVPAIPAAFGVLTDA